ncbi:hypothetical protein FZEAL_10911 [Fusarium zealandicum]|uniref:Uncharacterized protein n=1 Tax=Fusarium zealandicum TaxID=1053134 RepID=A0A8H4TTY8_9HYPO|nr:hypothetical protein FZEAL_10911 [Fusarium zealandicum]
MIDAPAQPYDFRHKHDHDHRHYLYHQNMGQLHHPPPHNEPRGPPFHPQNPGGPQPEPFFHGHYPFAPIPAFQPQPNPPISLLSSPSSPSPTITTVTNSTLTNSTLSTAVIPSPPITIPSWNTPSRSTSAPTSVASITPSESVSVALRRGRHVHSTSDSDHVVYLDNDRPVNLALARRALHDSTVDQLHRRLDSIAEKLTGFMIWRITAQVEQRFPHLPDDLARSRHAWYQVALVISEVLEEKLTGERLEDRGAFRKRFWWWLMV